MKFAVITPTILRSSLAEACYTVDEQTHGDWLHIVAVDIPQRECTGAQLELLWSVESPRRQVVHCDRRHKNFGNTCRHNAGALAMGCDFVLYLDDDDLYDPMLMETLERHIKNENWGVFLVRRFGQLYLPVPPKRNKTASIQLYHRPGLERWPDVRDYDADGILVNALHGRDPSYGVVAKGPLAYVEKQQWGLSDEDKKTIPS